MPEAMHWPDRMSPTDALLWFMDKLPEFRSTIGVLFLLKGEASAAALRHEFERLAAQVPRLRQKVVDVPLALAPPEWVDDPTFDLDYHLGVVPASASLGELLEELGPLYAAPFDTEYPLWHAYVAEGPVEGHTAVFFKMHHCLTDGVGGARLVEALHGERRRPAVPARTASVTPPSTDPATLLWRAALYDLGEATGFARALGRTLLDGVRDPRDGVERVVRCVRAGAGLAQELGVRRAPSPSEATRSLARRLATYDMRRKDVNEARGRLGATLNDIVLLVLSGAMHRWHRLHGEEVEELRALVPVSLRGEEERTAGNRMALLAVSLPVGEPNPLRRLRRIQERVEKVKADRRATLYPWLARAMLALPMPVAARVSRRHAGRANFVCANVSGPRRVCFFAGQPIERIYPYVPLIGDHPLAVAFFSYRDRICVGLDVDPLAMVDLARFKGAFAEAYEEVLRVSRKSGASRSRRVRSAARSARPVRKVV